MHAVSWCFVLLGSVLLALTSHPCVALPLDLSPRQNPDGSQNNTMTIGDGSTEPVTSLPSPTTDPPSETLATPSTVLESPTTVVPTTPSDTPVQQSTIYDSDVSITPTTTPTRPTTFVDSSEPTQEPTPVRPVPERPGSPPAPTSDIYTEVIVTYYTDGTMAVTRITSTRKPTATPTDHSNQPRQQGEQASTSEGVSAGRVAGIAGGCGAAAVGAGLAIYIFRKLELKVKYLKMTSECIDLDVDRCLTVVLGVRETAVRKL
ncbi:hypothetical protein BC832DRAFT_100088 [Gaertneriomyces semiglobifer]|nr:hypothetical protein BC832DRAFT_100088 [Gaertneriomyces semiglobifer]